MLRKIIQFIVYSSKFIVKELFLCVLSAGLLIFSFPNYNIWLFAWIGFVPLFFALKNESKGKAFLLSYFTGIIFWLGIIYWLVHITFVGMIALVLYLALYFGIFGLIFSTINYELSTMNLLFISSIWVLLEYLRSHLFTGFGWALLGYSQYLNLPIIQIADITGAWGVSFLTMLVNVAIYSRLASRVSRLDGAKKYLVPLLGIIITLSYGYYKIYEPRTTPATLRGGSAKISGGNHEPRIKVSVIQGNIPQRLKWDIDSRDFIINKYISISREAVKDKPDLIIWPEAALPVVLEEEPVFFERAKDFVKEIKIPLLLGAVTLRDNLYYNSALLVSERGEPLRRYDKLHLVPFGEYIPLKKFLRFLETVVPIGDFTPGKDYTVFTLPTTYYLLPTKFSVLICFEDLIPKISRQFIKRSANLLVNITNDAWFGKTSSAYQHLCASVFRAVENRVFLVRAANTGVSGFIAPSGKIISLVQDRMGENIFISGYKTEKIAILKQNLSFYARYGDIFILACLLFVLYNIIPHLRK